MDPHISAHPIRHPFYLDEHGINRPQGPEKHKNYAEFASSGSGVVPIIRVINGREIRAHLICRYDDVKEVLRNPVFSRALAKDADDLDVSGTILGMDDPEHARIRGIVKDAFSRPAVARLRGTVAKTAAEHLAAMTARDHHADLVDDFALPLALDVICDMLGLPREDRMRFRAWGDMFLGTADLTRDQAARSQAEMGAYLWKEIERRRVRPTGDLLSRIAVAAADEPFDVQVKLPIALIVGGWETTASSIARFVHVLTTRPYGDHETGWAHLCDHPEEIDSAVTELERLYSPAAGDDMPRYTTADVVLPSGARLSRGDIVVPSADAANRDPRVFPAPERMDFRRSPNPHLTYGHGAHYCIGAHLGALEIRVAIGSLVRELPSLRLAVPPGEVAWKAGLGVTSPEHLPITW